MLTKVVVVGSPSQSSLLKYPALNLTPFCWICKTNGAD